MKCRRYIEKMQIGKMQKEKSQKFIDDKFMHLLADVDKMRNKFRMYISFSNQLAAKAIVLEALFNAIDECRNPRSPGDRIEIEYDERTDSIKVSDNGRGIPTDILELIFTTLNSGSNIDSGVKNDLETDTLGRNGVGTLAINALAEKVEIFTYRGGTENKVKRLVFVEGVKYEEETKSCDPSRHGLTVQFKPSKILGKATKIVWQHVKDELINLQFLNKKKVKMSSAYTNKDGKIEKDEYKTQPFEAILSLRNHKETIISDKMLISLENRNVEEEVAGKKYKRFVAMDVAFAFTSNTTNPYIDSFCNANNTIDNGSHLDAAIEGLCRYFQQAAKATLTDRDKIEIKWDDVKTGLSIAVALRTNMEEIFTNQTKHKVSHDELEKLLKDEVIDSLQSYFKENPNKLKECINLIKTNARARREGDKARNSVIKETLTNWSSFKMKNYDPCTNKGKEYKELYIIEGDSAKGSLKKSRDPMYQALFAIRGVSANVFKMTLDQIIGPINGNKEFRDLVKVMGCNVGTKFDITKLQFDKIIIASDADVDGLFIRSLLCSFFFKLFPEIILAGKLFIAEPPLYRIDDKHNPFVINKEDYNNRYIQKVMKEYKIGFPANKSMDDIEWLHKHALNDFLSASSSYVDDITMLSKHYLVNDRLIELMIEEFADNKFSTEQALVDNSYIDRMIKGLQVQKLMVRVGAEFEELYYDDNDQIIKGAIDGKYQSLEISERLIRKSLHLIDIVANHGPRYNETLELRAIKTGTESTLSMLSILKVLKKFQPTVMHRFKGLGENNDEDIRITIMDPNTRSLIRLQISDIENDMKVFQTLRGTSPLDTKSRKLMMRSYKIPKDLIDT